MKRTAPTQTQPVLLGSHTESIAKLCAQDQRENKYKTIMRYVNKSGWRSQGLGKWSGDKTKATWGNQLCPGLWLGPESPMPTGAWSSEPRPAMHGSLQYIVHILDPMPKQAEVAQRTAFLGSSPSSLSIFEWHSTKLFRESTLSSLLN